MPSLSVYLFGHNLEKIKYPYLASIASALALTSVTNNVPSVYYCECESEDDSLERILRCFPRELESGALQIRNHKWGTHHTIQAHICNYLLDEIGTKTDFALKLDADEVLAEWSFTRFMADLENIVYRPRVLAKPHYTHFCPDDKTTFPFIYQSKAVLSKTKNGFRYDLGKGGDACALSGAPEVQTSLEVFHFGKMAMGREREALYKEVEFTKLYYDMGFPDPRVEVQKENGYLDYMKVFEDAYNLGNFSEYHGPYPIFIHDWLKEMRQRSKEFKASL